MLADGSPTTSRRIARRLGESLVLLGAVLVAFGLWVGGEGGAIARFVFRLSALTGFLFAGWGLLVRAHRRAAGCFAAGALATVSQGLLVRLIVATGFEPVWLPWMIADGAAMAIGFGLGVRRWRAQRA